MSACFGLVTFICGFALFAAASASAVYWTSISFLVIIGLMSGIAATIIGGAALKRKQSLKGLALMGIILGGIGLAIGGLSILLAGL